MASNDRARRVVIVVAALAAAVVAVLVVARGRGGRTPAAAPAASTGADPWAAGAGGGTGTAKGSPFGNRVGRGLDALGLRQRPAGPPVEVTGVVRLAPAGTPVADAEVAFLNETGEHTAATDAGGRYTIKVASGVAWNVHARTDKAVGYPESFVPTGDAPVRDLEIHPTATVRGRVLDARGALVPGAEVSVFVDGATRGLLESALALSTTADDAGRYELAALPGTTMVKGARGLEQGVGVVATLAAGETADVDIRLNAPATVTGRVVDGDDQPVAGATILVAATIYTAGPTEKLRFESKADGSFDFVTPAGWVRVEARRSADLSPAVAQWIDAGKRLDGLVLKVAPPEALRGKVITSDGTPVSGARVRLNANAVYDTTTGGDGVFTASAIAGQTYIVRVRHSEGRLDQKVEAWTGDQTFVMPRFGRLRVVVKAGGAPGTAPRPVVDDATVTITSFLPAGEPSPRAPVDSQFRGAGGIVELGSLEPGLYDLAVSARGAGTTRLPRVVVGEGSARDLPVTLTASTTLRGVVKSGAQPIAGAQVTVDGRKTFTDARGAFALADLASGPVAIAVAKAGYGNTWVSAIAAEGAPPVAIELRGGDEVEGVGVVLTPGAGGAVIASVLPGSPADGKLAAGDVIVEVGGDDVTEAGVHDVIARLRGSPGSSVSIKVRRGADEAQIDVVRRRLSVPQGTPAVARLDARSPRPSPRPS